MPKIVKGEETLQQTVPSENTFSAEENAMNAVAQALPQGSTTVGAEMNTTHIKPSAIGSRVQATATLTAVEGRKLTFTVEACDSVGTIGRGIHVRYIVDKGRFMAKL